MLSWESIVLLWAECWDIEHNRVRDKEKYRTFRNTKQGLTFEESGVQIRYERAILFRRSGFARSHVPNEMAIKDGGSPILIVVASVDVQKNCLYVDVKGYSIHGVTWTLDFFPIDGDTADFNGPWDKLEEYIENTRFVSDDKKTYRIAITLVDSGWNTEYIYAFSARYPHGVYACKGVDYIRAGETYKLFDKGTLDRIGLPLAYHINTTKMKDRISNSMSILTWNDNELQPAWYCNFPEDFRDDYFKMFEAEDRVDEYDLYGRYKRTIWKPKHNAPNHSFDTYCYNMAALEIFADAYCREELELPGLDWNQFWEAIKGGQFIEP
jgi:phage terminase large subunit GpA-like protein